MPPLEFAWRLAATGAAFAFIFAGGGLLAVTVLPVLALLPGHSRARTQRLIYLTFRFYIGMLQILGLLRLDLEGAEKLRAPGGRLIVANHPSLLDVVLLMARIPKAQCVVKHELWTHPFLGPLMRRAGYIRNDLEPEEMIAACQAALRAGDSLIIFPEGTRSLPGSPLRFRRGFANVATLIGAPIQPVLITCDPPTLTKGESWWRIPRQRPVFRLRVDDCIDTGSYLSHRCRSIAARKLVDDLQKYYSEQLSYV